MFVLKADPYCGQYTRFSDGYYTGDIFDCHTINYDIELGVGDTPYSSDEDYVYTFWFHYFEY